MHLIFISKKQLSKTKGLKVNLEVQWFIYNSVGKGLLKQKECDDLLNETGQNVDISTFAQAAFDKKSAPLDEVNAEILLEKLEGILNTSIEQAGLEVPPPEEFLAEQRNYEAVFSEIPQMADEQLINFLRNLFMNIRSNCTSDIHFSANALPFIRNALRIEKLGNYVLTEEDAFRINTLFLNKEHRELLTEKNELVYALSFSNEERYRVALMKHKDGLAGTYHLLPNHIQTLEELGFKQKNSKTISTLLNHHNGLILLAGPIGSGKTTTLAALVEIMNKKRKDHIIMIEDPIEIVQTSESCNITQREIITHTKSYANAIKGALREDPDIIVIGELNDLETIEIAITASETGHLVIGTLPTGDTINTLNRIVDVFPPSQQPQIRAMISGSLRGIVCQKLLPTKDKHVAVACEILVNNLAVSNTVSEGKHHLLKPILQTGSKLGMCTMDESVFELYEKDLISGQTALNNIKDLNSYKSKITSEDSIS